MKLARVEAAVDGCDFVVPDDVVQECLWAVPVAAADPASP
jgi:hypothetical protein